MTRKDSKRVDVEIAALYEVVRAIVDHVNSGHALDKDILRSAREVFRNLRQAKLALPTGTLETLCRYARDYQVDGEVYWASEALRSDMEDQKTVVNGKKHDRSQEL